MEVAAGSGAPAAAGAGGDLPPSQTVRRPSARLSKSMTARPDAHASPPPDPWPATRAAATQLYINNLNEKVKKAPLKKALYAALSPFGSIVEITATRTMALKGQVRGRGGGRRGRGVAVSLAEVLAPDAAAPLHPP
jgi:hypothetical protein